MENLTKREQGQLLDCLLDMGELLLDAGAEVSRVEDTLSRVGRAYGARRMDVFVITSIISMTMEFPDEEAATETRRIHSGSSTDFVRLERLNELSRECCTDPLPLPELRARVDHIAAGRKPFRVIWSGSVLAAGAFAVFFGGTVWDGLAAAVFGLGICLLQRWLNRTELNPAAMNLLISLLVGLGVGATAKLIPGLHMDMILIGDIMLLIPGLAMTNAIRNILLGDTISGVVRLAESLLWAMALAGGIMMSLLLMEGIL